jgi:hypothetical protein
MSLETTCASPRSWSLNFSPRHASLRRVVRVVRVETLRDAECSLHTHLNAQKKERNTRHTLGRWSKHSAMSALFTRMYKLQVAPVRRCS